MPRSFLLNQRRQNVQRRSIASPAEACNLTPGDVGDDRAPPPRFPGVGVAQVDFYNRHASIDKGVFQGVAVVGQGAGVHDNTLDALPVVLDAVDQVAFQVGLIEGDIHPEGFRPLGNLLSDVVQALGPVDAGVAAAQYV